MPGDRGSFHQIQMNDAIKKKLIGTAFELEDVGFWDLKLKTMDVYFSPQIYTMLGYEPKEARIKFETWMDLMHPEDKIRVMPVVKEAVRKKERYSVEFRLKTKDGHYKWISGRAKTFQMDDNDEIFHAMGVHVDIDALKQNEIPLQQAQFELKKQKEQLQERNDEFSCLFKINEIVRNNTSSVEEMLQEIVKSISMAFLSPDQTYAKINFKGKDYISEPFQKTQTKLSSDITFHGRKVGFLEVFSSIENAYQDSQALVDNKIKFVDNLGKLITRTIERIRAEKQLQESEWKFRTLFETMAEGIVYHDTEGKIVTANPAAERILNLPLDKMKGRLTSDSRWKVVREDGTFFPGKEHPVMMAIETGLPVFGEIMGVYNQRKGQYQWIKVNAIPQYHEGETQPYQVYASFEDISREHEVNIRLQEINEKIESMNEELKISMKEAQKADKAKSEFMATMSHELRTPLNGVIGFSEILKFSGLNDEQNEYVDTVLISAKKLLDIISDILNYSSIDTKNFELQPKKTDLSLLIQKTCSMIQQKAVKKGLTFAVDMGEDMPQTVQVDSGKLRQVLLNLLSNAVKFTEKGRIGIKLTVVDKDDDNVRIRFQVTDTGIGIKEKDQEIIFKPFQQLDMSNTRKYEGTGLGLSISHNLLQKMGSSLKLKSTYNEGSTFSFELVLPYEDAQKQESCKYNAEILTAPLSIRSKTVLIAEDNVINMRYAKTALSKISKNIRIIQAKDGKEAYKLFLECNPDLVLMDIIMPEVDGYQATAMIRIRDQQTPIIAMTAKAYSEDREACLKAGMNDYITKPFSLGQLKEVLAKYF